MWTPLLKHDPLGDPSCISSSLFLSTLDSSYFYAGHVFLLEHKNFKRLNLSYFLGLLAKANLNIFRDFIKCKYHAHQLGTRKNFWHFCPPPKVSFSHS
jgi:hypothetical protein